MDYDSFIASLDATAPPPQATIALRALWYDARGQSESADRAASADDSHTTLRVRAYLARRRGDEHGSAKWYWKCGARPWEGSSESEWEDIVRTILVEFVVEQAYT